jgi:hypothetical protein
MTGFLAPCTEQWYRTTYRKCVEVFLRYMRHCIGNEQLSVTSVAMTIENSIVSPDQPFVRDLKW